MSVSIVRFILFLLGLVGFGWREWRAPHHPPTVPRLGRWVSNFGLGVLNSAIVSAACLACIFLASAQSYRFALFHFIPLPLPLRWFVEIMLLDALVYWLHRLYHRVPLLWRLHAVHHSDLDLDVSSASRFHPGEVLVSATVKVAFVFVLGISPTGLLAFEGVMLLCAQFQHANVALAPALERWLWLTVVPPAMHRLHHTPSVVDTDTNFGTILTLWDRLWGTLHERPREATEPFGIAAFAPHGQSLPHLLWLPLRWRWSAAAP